MVELTLRALGQDLTLTYSQWLELLEELRPESDLARRVSSLLKRAETEHQSAH